MNEINNMYVILLVNTDLPVFKSTRVANEQVS